MTVADGPARRAARAYLSALHKTDVKNGQIKI